MVYRRNYLSTAKTTTALFTLINTQYLKMICIRQLISILLLTFQTTNCVKIWYTDSDYGNCILQIPESENRQFEILIYPFRPFFNRTYHKNEKYKKSKIIEVKSEFFVRKLNGFKYFKF